MKKLLPAILLTIATACAQASLTQTWAGWLAFAKSGRINEHSPFLYEMDAQLRFDKTPSLLYQGVFRGSLGVQTTQNVELWFGYAWIPSIDFSYHGGKNHNYEQRLFQQYNRALSNNARQKIAIRSRLEERQLNGNPAIALRFRQKISWHIKHIVLRNRFTPYLSEELLVNLNHPSWIGQNIIDQNRLFIGVDFHCFQGQHCRVGYLNQYLVRSPTDEMIHILSFSLLL